MRNRNLAASLFGLLTFDALLGSVAGKPQAGAAISSEAKSPGNLGGQMPPAFDQDVAMTDQKEDALVAFLKTLTDGYVVPSPRTAR